MTDIQTVMRPREGVGELIEAHLAKEITYAELLEQVAAKGFRTTSIFEMVCAAEAAQ